MSKRRLLACGFGLLVCAHGRAQTTEIVSVDSLGAQGNSHSFLSPPPALSGDARYVAFRSAASNLVPGDTNAAIDIFVRDRQNGTTERVSVGPGGVEANAASDSCAISADGRRVAFASTATNLVLNDTNGVFDVFVRDLAAGTTERVSVDSAEVQANGASGMLAYLALSADGRFVAFQSFASNLVPGDTNAIHDIFVRDRLSGTTERVSVDSAEVQANSLSSYVSISADGRYVAFRSYAGNLIANDANFSSDVFVRDRLAGTTENVSVASNGTQGNADSSSPAISGDGRYVAFTSEARNLVQGDNNARDDIFVHDRQSGATTRVSVDSLGAQSNQSSNSPAIDAAGRSVAFLSPASNLVAGDTNLAPDVFIHDMQSGTTERVNVDTSGAQANNITNEFALSANGRSVAFQSLASNLVANDTNGFHDVFVHDRGCLVTSFCTAKVNSAGCTPSTAWSGTPSATSASGFFVNAEQVLPAKAGILFYGNSGPGGGPFQGGTLCMTLPVRRTPLQTSTAAGSPPCTGIYTFDFNARIASGVDPALVAGTQVWAQYFTRDAGVPSGTGLTNGLTFVICD